jgi:hypothetical protein
METVRRRHWHYSLFQLGLGWMEHLRSLNQPLPVRWHLYSSTRPRLDQVKPFEVMQEYVDYYNRRRRYKGIE